MRRLLLALLAAPLISASLGAQAAFYPALQPSRVAVREYTFAVADLSGGGTGLIFQWREGLGTKGLQFTIDGGIVDAEVPGAATQLAFGTGLAYQALTATEDLPFDIVLGGGIGITTGETTTTRIPFGATVGHRFALDQGVAVTPFIAPRLSWNRVAGSGASVSDTDIEVDLGANIEVKPQVALRFAAIIGDNNAFALAVALTPKGLERR
ncbi:MAG: hypothetical protein RL139_971 [Gemmatimonadota bacterium]|jgi:hypothetical protein